MQDQDSDNWSDFDLANYLNAAQEVYVQRTGVLRGNMIIENNQDGKYEMPDDFLEFVFGYNQDYTEIKPISEKRLRAIYGAAIGEAGSPLYIYPGDDLDSFYLHPVPDVSITQEELDSDYGVISNIDDEVFDSDFGVIASYDDFPFDGELGVIATLDTIVSHGGVIHYIRKPLLNIIEVRCPEALIWYAAARCLEQEGEMEQKNKATMCDQIFNSMIGVENKLSVKQTGKKARGTFF